MKRIATLMAFGALTLAFGCDNRGGDTDGGIHLMDDDGGTGGHDAGMMTMHDSGSGTPDAGSTDTCPPAEAPNPTPAACEAETGPCLDECQTTSSSQPEYETCAGACFDADASADPPPNECLQCVNQAIIACATMNGCDEQYGEVICCAQANCPDGSCVSATSGPCMAQFGAFLACAQGAQTACATADDVCFMAAP